jgi:hypothetical protein
MSWSLIDIDGDRSTPKTSMLVALPSSSHPVSFHIINTWFFSTIANIANRDQVDPYISQVTGDHPTSTSLSKAKHLLNPDYIGFGVCILDKEGYNATRVLDNSYT